MTEGRDHSSGPGDEAPQPPAAPARRQRRFSIPEAEDHQRVAEKIEAFLQGPAVRPPRHRHSRHPAARPALSATAEIVDRPAPHPVESRADWNAALRHESARHERYGRPVAVVVIEVVVTDQLGSEPSRATLDGLAGALGQMLREMSRATDRVARFGPTRFNVLLPETGRPEARRFAERARALAEEGLVRGSLSATLRIAIASPGGDERLAEALATAEMQLAS